MVSIYFKNYYNKINFNLINNSIDFDNNKKSVKAFRELQINSNNGK